MINFRRTILRNIRRTFSTDFIEFAFQNKDGSLTPVKARKGQTVLEIAHTNTIDLEGACESSLACRYIQNY